MQILQGILQAGHRGQIQGPDLPEMQAEAEERGMRTEFRDGSRARTASLKNKIDTV
jgi:hypothetical protein